MSKTNSFAMGTKIEKRIKLVPPDGGWGWMVLIGTGISNIFNQSMLSLFSLLYGDALESMGYSTSGAAIVLSSMLFVSNFGGPIAGAVTKLTSPRFVAVFGACSCTCGIFFSGFSTNIYHLMLTYGFFLGLGLGFIQNSSFVAINSYFMQKKSIAVGLAMAGTGIGQTLMPHVVRYLLEEYGFKGACILLASLSLHGIGGTLLLQPVEWHMKKVEEDVVVEEKVHLLQENNISEKKENGNAEQNKNGRRATEPSIKVENGVEKSAKSVSQSYKELPIAEGLIPNEKSNGHVVEKTIPQKTILQKIYDLFDISLLSSPRFLNIIIGISLTVVSVQNFSLLFPLFLQKAASMNKQQTAYCMSAIASVDIVGRIVLPIFQSRFKISARMMLCLTSAWIIVVRQSHVVEKTIPEKTLLQKIYDLFDISLLSSPRFLNIIIGTSLTVVSVQNFSLLFPLFLQKAASMNKQQTAYCMSAIASVDIVGRIVLPIFQSRFKISARMMLCLTSAWIIVVRQIMASQTDLYVLLVLSGVYGFGRSMIIVARNIAISEQCRLDQVPSAVGLGMLTMGIIVPPSGWFLGWIRDYTGSYAVCITAQNLLLVLFLLMWIPDMLYLHLQSKKVKPKENV